VFLNFVVRETARLVAEVEARAGEAEQAAAWARQAEAAAVTRAERARTTSPAGKAPAP
jgi:hypothetical protein